ncbi:MAG: hypothetical protein ACFHWX_15040 [Bacteroidota bacterium]
MSLTSILDYKNKSFRDFRDFLNENFPTPKLESSAKLVAEPLSANSALIGTAYDYLLRFHLEKLFEKKVISKSWVAESAVKKYFRTESITPDSGINLTKLSYEKLDKMTRAIWEQSQRVHEHLDQSKMTYQEFVVSQNPDNYKIIECCLFLARLDTVFRIGWKGRKYITFLPEEENDITDLKQLIEVCDFNLFKPQKTAILNPTFGEGSHLVKGADADILIDNLLIDIKVTRELKLKRSYLNQLIGYYILYLIGGIDQNSDAKIDTLGIYFARHNFLWTIHINELADSSKFDSAKDFLMKKLKK